MIKPSDREKLQDCLFWSNRRTRFWRRIHDGLLPDIDDLQKCFDDADRTLTALLRR